jgi:hypothetical protein
VTFVGIALVALSIRKFWKWVKLKNEQRDFEAQFMAGLRKALEEKE